LYYQQYIICSVQGVDNPEQMCIGSVSTALTDLSQCGDFAGEF